MTHYHKYLAGLLALILGASCLTGCSGKPKITDGNYPATEYFVKEIGRYYVDDKSEATWFSQTASGIEFNYKDCTSCEIELVGDRKATYDSAAEHRARYAIYVNGTLVIDAMMEHIEDTVTVPLEGTSGTIRVLKLSEAADSSLGIKNIHVDGTISATKAKKLKIEFIGDSITNAYGVEGTLNDTYSTATENGTKSYAYKTAQALDADYSMVAYSGYTVYSGSASSTKPDPEMVMTKYYEKFSNCSTDMRIGLNPKYILWDFSKFTPDYVVINLGTNDVDYCKNDAERAAFTEEYVEFIKLVREKYPKAMIICTLGVMEQDLCMNVMDAVSKYSSATGDDKVDYLMLDRQEGAVGIDYHPTEESHAHAAEQLTAFIRELEGK